MMEIKQIEQCKACIHDTLQGYLNVCGSCGNSYLNLELKKQIGKDNQVKAKGKTED